jgi:hypothetical protein
MVVFFRVCAMQHQSTLEVMYIHESNRSVRKRSPSRACISSCCGGAAA